MSPLGLIKETLQITKTGFFKKKQVLQLFPTNSIILQIVNC